MSFSPVSLDFYCVEEWSDTTIEASDLKLRLESLGFKPGQVVEYIGRSPLKGPHLLKIDSTLIGLRPNELACLNLKKIK